MRICDVCRKEITDGARSLAISLQCLPGHPKETWVGQNSTAFVFREACNECSQEVRVHIWGAARKRIGELRDHAFATPSVEPAIAERPSVPGWYACRSRDMELCSLYWIDANHLEGLSSHFEWYYGPLPIGPKPEIKADHA